MDDRGGGQPPYVTVTLTWGMTEHPELGPFIRGKLVRAGVDLRTPLAAWLDAVYSLWVEQPDGDILARANRTMIIETAKARPDRDTWGALPEQQALGITKIVRGPGLQGGPPTHEARPR